MSWLKQTIKYAGILLGIFFGVILLNTKILSFSFVPSASMEPTICTNSLVVGSRINKTEISRYDIVTFLENDTIYIKRVIGLPGETVSIRDNLVYAEGRLTETGFTKEPLKSRDIEYTVPKDCVFVMGDNRNHSADSRVFGAVPIKNILSKSKLVLFPYIKTLGGR